MRTGRPPKFKDDTMSVLYVRVPSRMLEALDQIVRKQQAQSPDKMVSRADVARDLLNEGIRKEELCQ